MTKGDIKRCQVQTCNQILNLAIVQMCKLNLKYFVNLLNLELNIIHRIIVDEVLIKITPTCVLETRIDAH